MDKLWDFIGIQKEGEVLSSEVYAQRLYKILQVERSVIKSKVHF